MEANQVTGRFNYNDDLHEYRLDGKLMDHVTGVLTSVGIIDLNQIPEGRLETARSRGSRLHRATLLDDMGELDDRGLSEDLVGGLASWRKFRRDSNLQILEAEQVIYNEQLWIAGTYDRIMRDSKGQKCLIEIKPPVVPPYTGLQLAWYELVLGNSYFRRFGVGLRPDGKPNVVPFTDRNDRNIVLGALATARWKRENL